MEESKVMKGTSPETMLETYNAAYYSCVPVLLMGAKPTPSTSKVLMEKVDWTSLFNPNSKFYTAIRNALLPLNTEGRTLYLRTFIAHRLSNYSMFSKDDEKGNILCGFVLKAKNILDEQKNLSSVTDEERYIFQLYIYGRQIVENLGELASMCGVDWSAIAKEYGLVWAEEDAKEAAEKELETEASSDIPYDVLRLFGNNRSNYMKFHNEAKGKAPRYIAEAYKKYATITPENEKGIPTTIYNYLKEQGIRVTSEDNFRKAFKKIFAKV